jgi:hypothetical protein
VAESPVRLALQSVTDGATWPIVYAMPTTMAATVANFTIDKTLSTVWRLRAASSAGDPPGRVSVESGPMGFSGRSVENESGASWVSVLEAVPSLHQATGPFATCE